MLKKMFGMLAAASLFTALACGTVFAEAEDITGEWYMISMTQGEEVIDASMLAMFGYSATLTLGEDGSATMEMTDSEATVGTYTWDGEAGEVTMEGESVPFAITDGVLELAEEDTAISFSREAPEAAAFEVADPVEEAELADYDGLWVAETFVMGSTPMPMEAIGMGMTLEIENGTVTATTSYGTMYADETEEPEEPEVVTVTGELKDSALFLADLDGEATSLQLCQDGTMTLRNGTGESAEEETEAMSESEIATEFDAYMVFVKAE